MAFLAQIGVQRVPSKGAWVTHALAGSLMSGDGQGSKAMLCSECLQPGTRESSSVNWAGRWPRSVGGG